MAPLDRWRLCLATDKVIKIICCIHQSYILTRLYWLESATCHRERNMQSYQNQNGDASVIPLQNKVDEARGLR